MRKIWCIQFMTFNNWIISERERENEQLRHGRAWIGSMHGVRVHAALLKVREVWHVVMHVKLDGHQHNAHTSPPHNIAAQTQIGVRRS
jgi:hypothetical protein